MLEMQNVEPSLLILTFPEQMRQQLFLTKILLTCGYISYIVPVNKYSLLSTRNFSQLVSFSNPTKQSSHDKFL